MEDANVIAVVGTCAPERGKHAAKLAAATGAHLIPARRLAMAPDPLDEALALAPWSARSPGAVVEFPADARATELIGALTSEDNGIRLCGIVCVIDASHLLDDLQRDSYAARPLLRLPRSTRVEYVAHAMLTVTQIEYASMVVLVNWDGLSTPDLSAVMALVSHLSPGARLRLEHGPVEAPADRTYSAEQERPGWIRLLNGEHDPHMTDPRVSALRYEQLRPLHPGRLGQLLDERIEPGEFGTVIRSAGFCRLATRAHVVAEWSHVGRMFALEPAGADDHLEDDDELLALGQDLAFIGLDLDRRGLAAALDHAALTDDELAAGPRAWADFADPFPDWDWATDRAE